MLLNGIQNGDFLPVSALKNFAEQALILIFLNLGVFFYIIRMGGAINKGKFFGKRYTRIMVPSFLFIILTDFFYIIFSTLQRRIFKGCLARKQPN